MLASVYKSLHPLAKLKTNIESMNMVSYSPIYYCIYAQNNKFHCYQRLPIEM